MAEANSWNTQSYDRDTRFVTDYGNAVVDLLAPKAGERILDLGCGDGPLMATIAQSGAEVVGVDTSENFIATAKAAGHDARLMDGEALTFDSEFNAVFSNAAIHWMLDKPAVCRSAARALKPGGRFVGEFGGHGNVAAVVSVMYAVGEAMGGDVSLAQPGTYPTVKAFATMLTEAGFDVHSIETFARPTPLPNGMESWLRVMRAPFFAQFGEREDEAYARVLRALEPSLCDGEGTWHADYWRLRFDARLPR
ncbi:methyltransferase domain-containing protein [Rhizobiaceae bacterium]|nr:methyltransferase domain-containing protein [Rhizobiaceae bacterium]